MDVDELRAKWLKVWEERESRGMFRHITELGKAPALISCMLIDKSTHMGLTNWEELFDVTCFEECKNRISDLLVNRDRVQEILRDIQAKQQVPYIISEFCDVCAKWGLRYWGGDIERVPEESAWGKRVELWQEPSK